MAKPFFPLFRSTPAEFLSDYSLDESVERLRAVIKPSIFQTIFEEAAVGKVRQSRVWIWRYTPMFANSFRPFFIGSFQENSGQVVLAGAFTLHIFVKVFMTFWFGLLGFFAVLTATLGVNGNAADTDLALLVLLGFFAFGFVLVRLGQWLSRNDVPWLSAVIRQALSKGRDHPGPMGAQASPIGMGQLQVSMVVLKILVAFCVFGGLVSAATGIASIHTGPRGDLVVTEHTDISRVGAVLAAGLAAGFLFGLHTRAPLTWPVGWGLLVISVLSGLVHGLVLVLENPMNLPIPQQRIFCIFWFVGGPLVETHLGLWWWKQRGYFSRGTPRAMT